MMIVQGGEIDRKVYPDVDQFFTDLSRAYAVADLSKAGCPYATWLACR